MPKKIRFIQLRREDGKPAKKHSNLLTRMTRLNPEASALLPHLVNQPGDFIKKRGR